MCVSLSDLRCNFRHLYSHTPSQLTETELSDMPVKALSWAVMWSMGLLQDYQLLDWIDNRDFHALSSVRPYR